MRWYLRCYVSGGLSGFLDKCCGGTAGIFTWHQDFLFLAEAEARNYFYCDFELAIVFRQANTATIMPEGGDPQYTFLAFYCWKSICMCCWKCVCGVGRMYLLLEICRYNTVQILHCRVRWQVLCQKEGPTRHSGWIPFPRVMELCCHASDSAEPNQNI